MNPDELALLQAAVSSLPVQAFLFYAWYQERSERILRTNQLVKKVEDSENVQLQKEQKEKAATN